MKLNKMNIAIALLTTLVVSSSSAFLANKDEAVKSDKYTIEDIGLLGKSFNNDFILHTVDRKVPATVYSYEETKLATLYFVNSLTSYFLVGDNYQVFSYGYDVRILTIKENIEYNEVSREFNSSFTFKRFHKEMK